MGIIDIQQMDNTESVSDDTSEDQNVLDAVQLYIEEWITRESNKELMPVFSRRKIPMIGTGLVVEFPPGGMSIRIPHLFQNISTLYNVKVIKQSTNDNSWVVVPPTNQVSIKF